MTHIESFDGERISTSTLKWILFFTFIFVAIIGFAGWGGAVACNSILSTDRCTIANNTYLKLDGNVHYVNGSDFDASIQINGQNATLDCNGSRLIGNTTTFTSTWSTIAISIGQNNATVKNCYLENYRFGIVSYAGFNNSKIINNTIGWTYYGTRLFTGSNNSVANNTFNNISYSGIYINSLTDRSLLENNIFYNTTRFLYIDSAGNLNNGVVRNNNLISLTSAQDTTRIVNSTGINYINNTIISTLDTYTMRLINVSISNFSKSNFCNGGGKGLLLQQSNGNLIDSNIFFNCTTYQSVYNTNSSDNIFFNNTMNLNSKGLVIGDYSNNILVYNNTINNSIYGTDGWRMSMLGYSLGGSSNVKVFNNYFDNAGCQGIQVWQGNNWSIYNNTFRAIGLDRIISDDVECAFEARTGIGFQELWKTYIADSTESESDNISKITNYSSRNVYVSGNIFYNYPVLLRTQGIQNLTYSLPEHYKITAQFPTYLLDQDNFYIDNNQECIYNINNTNDVNYLLGQGFKGSTVGIKIKYTICRNYQYYKNVNITRNYTVISFNQTSALAFSSNGSLPCGNSLFTGDCNITIQPNNYSYVYNNYVLTESSTLPGDPLDITSKTSASAHITSSLNSQVQNIPVSMTLTECSKIKTLTYVSDTGIKQTITPSCSGDTATFTLEKIDPSMSSNILSWTYVTTDGLASRILRMTVGFMAILVLFIGLSGVFLYIKKEGFTLNGNQMITLFIILIVAVILLGVLAQYILDVT